MAESLTIARPYAEAAFKAAIEQGPDSLAASLGNWGDALGRLSEVVQQPLAHGVLSDPGVTSEQIAGLLAEVAGNLSPGQINFVALLAANDRLTVLPEIATLFNRLRNSQENVLDAHVRSAYPLTDAQTDQIRSTLQTKYGKRVNVTSSVDPDLIGGVSIRIGDEVTDLSVRGKLAKLAASLTN